MLENMERLEESMMVLFDIDMPHTEMTATIRSGMMKLRESLRFSLAIAEAKIIITALKEPRQLFEKHCRAG